MNKTSNYQLNQWELTDRIRMEDFNGDNAKIDAALKTLANQVASKANSSTVSSLTTKVNAKAEQSALTAAVDRITALESGKASKTDLEAANTSLDALTTQVSKCGNCRVVCGSYVGNDKFGSANPNSLTFDAPPVMVVIRDQSCSGSDVQQMVLMQGCLTANGTGTGNNTIVTVSWNGSSVQWYSDTNTYVQYSVGNHTYYYTAFLMADQ